MADQNNEAIDGQQVEDNLTLGTCHKSAGIKTTQTIVKAIVNSQAFLNPKC